jgi:hypothetical protein
MAGLPLWLFALIGVEFVVGGVFLWFTRPKPKPKPTRYKILVEKVEDA